MVLRLSRSFGPLLMVLLDLLVGFESIFVLSAVLAVAMIPVAARIVR